MATYKLTRWIIRKNKNGTARVHLHGVRDRWFSEPEKHIDYVTLALLPEETDAELVRCAVAASPHRWKVDLWTNLFKFGGKLNWLPARLASTLPRTSSVSSSNVP